MKNQYASGWSRHFVVVQNISNHVLARRRQSGGRQIDRAIALLVGPVKDSENALPVSSLRKKTLGCPSSAAKFIRSNWYRCPSQTNHLNQFLILNQGEALRCV